MATKPTSKPFWATTGDKTEPSGSKKATGWLKLEKPPYQFFNWLFNTINEFIDYLSGNAQYNIIVGGDSDERDYATMAAYIADSPAAGDRVLIKADEVLAATLTIPDNIEVTILKGNEFTLATNFSPIIEVGVNVKIKSELRVENSDTGTIAKGFSFTGDSSHSDNLIVENKSTGTITDAFYIEAGTEGIYSQCRSINSGGGAITNDLTDNSGNDENHVTVKGDSAISRSRGAKKFDKPAIADFTDATHDHQDDAGGGLLALSIRDISRNLIIVNGGTPDEQVDIDADELILQNVAETSKRLTGINFTADNTASGQNGLFTGSVAATTWYFIWITNGSSGTTSGLHLSSDLATVLGDAPAGYEDFGALVGAIWTDGTSDFILIFQKDNRVVRSFAAVLTDGAAGSYTSVDLSAVIPVTAKAIGGELKTSPTIANGGNANVASKSSGEGQRRTTSNQETVAIGAPFMLPIIEAQTIYYSSSNSTLTSIWVSEWGY